MGAWPIQEPVGVVYKITNLETGDAYIGITRQTAARRFAGHWKASKREDNVLYRAMRKYGRDAFKIEVIASASSAAALCRLEQELIASQETHVRCGGYNMTGGGEGSPDICEETRARMRAAAARRVADPLVREKISRSLKGKKQSPEATAKSAASRTGRRLTAAHRKKLSEAQKGRIVTATQREKIAASLRGRKPSAQALENQRRAMLGREVSQETRRKISEAHRRPENQALKSAASKRAWSENPARKDAMRARVKKRWTDPVFREQQLTALQAGHSKWRAGRGV